MKIEELLSEWATDAHIDQSKLASAAADVALLHSKYYRILLDERLLLMRLRTHQEALELILDGYYSKTLTQDELSSNGLVYSDKRVLKVDIPKHISTHPKMVELLLKIGVQVEKTKFLEDILKMIHSRNFLIKNIIDVKRFEAGQ